jgi:hypothetical protein
MFYKIKVKYKIDGKTYNNTFNDSTLDTVIWLISEKHSRSTSVIDILKKERGI